jgi:glucose/arabinose dehydrogenase
MASCATVDLEEASMPLNDTPFGLDWERGVWGGTYAHGVFVAKHGSFYHSPRWRSAGIWWAPANPSTHAPTGEFTLLVGGFAEASPELRRAVDVAFAPDGRLFFADDYGGIFWVAPDTLRSR